VNYFGKNLHKKVRLKCSNDFKLKITFKKNRSNLPHIKDMMPKFYRFASISFITDNTTKSRQRIPFIPCDVMIPWILLGIGNQARLNNQRRSLRVQYQRRKFSDKKAYLASFQIVSIWWRNSSGKGSWDPHVAVSNYIRFVVPWYWQRAGRLVHVYS